jgi:hypothetical protein
MYRRNKNEKGIPDYSDPAAIGGLGGCTEHIDFTQFAAVNKLDRLTINISIIHDTRNESPIKSFFNVAVLNYAEPATDNSGHDFKPVDVLNPEQSDIERQFILDH